MPRIEKYRNALATALTNINGNNNVWYGGANNHKPIKHFSIWTIRDEKSATLPTMEQNLLLLLSIRQTKNK